MNFRRAIRASALALAVVALAMAPIAGWALWVGDWATAESFVTTLLIAFAIVVGLVVGLPRSTGAFGRRDAFLMVGLTWLAAPILAGLPFWLWAEFFHDGPLASHAFKSAINCYFEAMSGLTTTGASILPDIESIPHGLLLWRSTTHWLGGLGIVLLFVALLPMVGATGRKLHLVESTGPSPEGPQPRIQDTARILWISYAVITLLAILALHLAGLPWFNAICEAFGAIATGGFSVRNQSIAGYDSALVDAIIVAVMLLGAVNFSLYYQLARGQWRQVWRDPELRWMLVLIAGGALTVMLTIRGLTIVTMAGRHVDAGWMEAIRYGLLNLVSMHTDAGFATADFDLWPFTAIAAIVIGTFIGGSAGSTTGGIKVARVIAAAKVLLNHLQRCIRPAEVRPVRLGGRILDTAEQSGVMVTVLCFILALGAGTVLLMLIGSPTGLMDLRTAFGAALANLCTAGPGLGATGPTQNYEWLPPASKLVLCGLMLIGRLEILPLLALMHPAFWASR